MSVHNHSHGHQKLHVRMLPDWRLGNPYQALLAESLTRQGVSVSFGSAYRRILPLYRDQRSQNKHGFIYHLHWLDNHIKFHDLPRRLVYSQKFILDLSLLKMNVPGIVWTIHNLRPHESRHPWLEKRIARKVSERVDHLIAHGNKAKELILDYHHVDAKKVSVIPIGNYNSIFGRALPQESSRASLNIGPQYNKVILYFGNIRPYKGVHDLLEAWQLLELDPRRKSALLIIAGQVPDKTYEKKLRGMAQGQKSIRLMFERINEDVVPLLFSSSSFAILPFTDVLTSSSLLLALGYGREIIAPDIAVVRETLGSLSRYLYSKNQGSSGLALRIRDALKARESGFSEQAYQRSLVFDWDNIARQTKSLYKQILLNHQRLSVSGINSPV